MYIYLKVIIVATLSLAFIACSKVYSEEGIIKNKKYAYKQSQHGKKLVVPPDLNHQVRTNYYDLPEAKSNAKLSVVPPGSSLANA